ncbi:Rhodanese-like domain-containing protein [Lipomyces arxii]|uniref:Rhodanese-like domain-containing protein n=1 Tax=Lipomyces arxii TaxID=56418 RepID=UPI0034CD3BD9
MPPKPLDKHTLKEWLLNSDATNRPKNFVVIDVRDDDHIGGHIVKSRNHPSASFTHNLPYLHEELHQVPALIFHCALSQQRGPAAASMYLSYRDRIASSDKSDQQIYVLTGGFTEWQKEFGKDQRLTEAFDEKLWKYYT